MTSSGCPTSRRVPSALARELMSSIVVTRQGRVAVLTLNRPDHGNRLTTALAAELAAALRAARDDATIGACVLTGAGDVFCLGGDYRGAGPTDEGRAAYADVSLHFFHACAFKLSGQLHALFGRGAIVGRQPVRYVNSEISQ